MKDINIDGHILTIKNKIEELSIVEFDRLNKLEGEINILAGVLWGNVKNMAEMRTSRLEEMEILLKEGDTVGALDLKEVEDDAQYMLYESYANSARHKIEELVWQTLTELGANLTDAGYLVSVLNFEDFFLFELEDETEEYTAQRKETIYYKIKIDFLNIWDWFEQADPIDAFQFEDSPNIPEQNKLKTRIAQKLGIKTSCPLVTFRLWAPMFSSVLRESFATKVANQIGAYDEKTKANDFSKLSTLLALVFRPEGEKYDYMSDDAYQILRDKNKGDTDAEKLAQYSKTIQYVMSERKKVFDQLPITAALQLLLAWQKKKNVWQKCFQVCTLATRQLRKKKRRKLDKILNRSD